MIYHVYHSGYHPNTYYVFKTVDGKLYTHVVIYNELNFHLFEYEFYNSHNWINSFYDKISSVDNSTTMYKICKTKSINKILDSIRIYQKFIKL